MNDFPELVHAIVLALSDELGDKYDVKPTRGTYYYGIRIHLPCKETITLHYSDQQIYCIGLLWDIADPKWIPNIVKKIQDHNTKVVHWWEAVDTVAGMVWNRPKFET